MRIGDFTKRPVERDTLQSVALERHYSVPEIAELWAMSEKSVRKLFAGEGGVPHGEVQRP